MWSINFNHTKNQCFASWWTVNWVTLCTNVLCILAICHTTKCHPFCRKRDLQATSLTQNQTPRLSLLPMASQLAAALVLVHDEGGSSSDDGGNHGPPPAPANRSRKHMHMMRKSTPAGIVCEEDGGISDKVWILKIHISSYIILIRLILLMAEILCQLRGWLSVLQGRFYMSLVVQDVSHQQ